MLGKVVVLLSILLTAVLGSGCGDNNPSAPSPIPASDAPAAPAPAPSPVPDISGLAGRWNLTVRITEVKGTGCIAETMRSQIGVPKPYTLSVTQKERNVEVTLTSASGDYACTFTPLTDSTSFTTYGKGGYYTCEQQFIDFRCGDGTPHGIFTYGEDISGRLSGAGMTGTWDADWVDALSAPDVEMKAEFSGTR